MSHAQVPPNVDAADAELLRRAYALQTQEEGADLYREWAETYDRTMIDGLGWVSPAQLSQMFAAHTPWRDRPVLDLACGTGLIGQHLSEAGFTTIDGLDLSRSMMDVAAKRGSYRNFYEGDLNLPLPFPDAAYGAAICNGTFTSGHVGAACLPEILRLVAPGGTFASAINNAVWHELGFEAMLASLCDDGVIEAVEVLEIPYYTSSTGNDGRLLIHRRL